MQTVDFHTHLLNPEVSFSRLYDKIAISLFAKKLGIDKRELLDKKYEAFVSAYARNIKTSKKVKKSVLLPVDAIVDKNGKEISKDKTVCSSSEDVLRESLKYPDEFIPFFSVNPNRVDALDLIDKYAEFGFKGAKLLQNYWNIDINQEKYIPYFEKIKSYDLPIIIHSGSEYAVSSNREFEKINVSNLAIEIGCKVVIAHFGVDMLMQRKVNKLHHNFSFDSSKYGDEYYTMLEYLQKHKNVYADLSALISLFRSKIIDDLANNQKDIHNKILFGTDYPVPFSVLFSYHNLSLKKRMAIEKIENPLDRYIEFLNQYFDKDSQIYSNWEKLIKV